MSHPDVTPEPIKWADLWGMDPAYSHEDIQCLGWGGTSRAVATDMDLGRGRFRTPEYGMRRAVWDVCHGYVSGFRKRDIFYFVITRSLSRRLSLWFIRVGR